MAQTKKTPAKKMQQKKVETKKTVQQPSENALESIFKPSIVLVSSLKKENTKEDVKVNAAIDSQPFIVEVANNGGPEDEIEIFGAFNHLPGSGYGTFIDGSLYKNNIVVSSKFTPNISYLGLLYQSIVCPFLVGKTILHVRKGKDTDLPKKLNWRNIQQGTGNVGERPIKFVKSLFQQQTSQVSNTIDTYIIDGNKELKFIVPAYCILRLWFYPSKEINPSSTL